jgi:predicted dehydrogenase
MKLRIAFVGAGYMAEEHVKAFADASDVQLVGICSRGQERAQSLAGKYAIDQVFTSIAQMYAEAMPQAVVVSVPELATAKVCGEVFEYPWTSLIEKPVGYNFVEAKSLVEKAKAKVHRAYVALNRRHYSSTRGVLADLEGHSDQRLVHVLDQENPLAALQAGQPPAVVDNWMYANSIHIIDYFKLFCRGDLQDVNHVIKWNADSPGFVLAKLAFSSGDVGIYEAVWNAPGPWAVTVTTHKKRWELRPLEQGFTQLYGSRKSEAMQVDPCDVKFKAGIRLQAKELLSVLRGEPAFLPTIEDALETMDLVRQIYES